MTKDAGHSTTHNFFVVLGGNYFKHILTF